MRDENKIPLDDIKARLQAQMNYRHEHIAFKALFDCWVRHPRFRSPARQTINTRIRNDGFAWLKEKELSSFENYCGRPLR